MAVLHRVPIVTTITGANAVVKAIAELQEKGVGCEAAAGIWREMTND